MINHLFNTKSHIIRYFVKTVQINEVVCRFGILIGDAESIDDGRD